MKAESLWVVLAIGDRVTAFEDDAPLGSTTDQKSWVGIVDDDPSLRTAIARVLRGNGIRVETFGSAEEFLRRSIASEPECIVLDVQLGGLSGFDLQDMLNARGTTPPIIFITAHDDFVSLGARARAASGYLRKPFDTQALVGLVRPHLRSLPAKL